MEQGRVTVLFFPEAKESSVGEGEGGAGATSMLSSFWSHLVGKPSSSLPSPGGKASLEYPGYKPGLQY